ncbi:hypothetical protein [Vreelandella arcis]|uniref:Glycosyltransferase involved in cell wall bisynthesis n=1 Tax=Vreelandella arcis TaxID=416873 RepID=A0A1H0ICC1_9GAMM|nr:hypothetical protein [Halomonas arcis]SDO28910.1 Glycosyltransferase involved in cell wall bisynthesis [Halomonas arcis]
MFTKHYTYVTGTVREGGSSRALAFLNITAKLGVKQIIFANRSRLGRLFEGFKLFISLLFLKNEVILIHYSVFPSIFSQHVVSNALFSYFIKILLRFCGLRNVVYIEVNDLPYEQALDLELPKNKMNVFDRNIFTQKDLYFIFASVEMARYAEIKYSIKKSKVSYLINGANMPLENEVSTWFSHDGFGLAFVYAGTLNRGRQIEDMIREFIGTNHSLILLGVGGSWIKSEYNQNENIFYLGSYPEKKAQNIVRQCDVGLIPYDENRFYYNICYPTKASFYAASGLPILSTPLKELKNHFTEETAFFAPLSEWGSLLSDPNLPIKAKVMASTVLDKTSQNFYWDNLWDIWLDENMSVSD